MERWRFLRSRALDLLTHFSISRETFGGAMALVLKWTVGPTLVDRLGDYGRDIKDFIEKNEGGGVVNNN